MFSLTSCWSTLKILNLRENQRSMSMTEKVRMSKCLFQLILELTKLTIFSETLRFGQTLKFRHKSENGYYDPFDTEKSSTIAPVLNLAFFSCGYKFKIKKQIWNPFHKFLRCQATNGFAFFLSAYQYHQCSFQHYLFSHVIFFSPRKDFHWRKNLYTAFHGYSCITLNKSGLRFSWTSCTINKHAIISFSKAIIPEYSLPSHLLNLRVFFFVFSS